MKVLNVTDIMEGWLEEGPADLSTWYDYGWPSRVADIVLLNKGRKVILLSSSASVEASTPVGEE